MNWPEVSSPPCFRVQSCRGLFLFAWNLFWADPGKAMGFSKNTFFTDWFPHSFMTVCVIPYYFGLAAPWLQLRKTLPQCFNKLTNDNGKASGSANYGDIYSGLPQDGDSLYTALVPAEGLEGSWHVCSWLSCIMGCFQSPSDKVFYNRVAKAHALTSCKLFFFAMQPFY